jgi:hypothetical protein
LSIISHQQTHASNYSKPGTELEQITDCVTDVVVSEQVFCEFIYEEYDA